MNNILFFLKMKRDCVYLDEDNTMRQALERMEKAKYSALPILSKTGEYRGTLTEGDLLWAIKGLCGMDLRQTENFRIMDIEHSHDNIPVTVDTSMRDLINCASAQNFVPVVDDKGTFIGIITRSSIIRYCQENIEIED